ncbi:CAP domain-containing protein [Hoeflea poritis]|uniref:CAP domain-containing protein n=1 Tax=Hoeflea poritis TaxID=2993659 RepID=A0ABT4VGX0_9HYPH|nr:CAP domain-containing protein [Hoeflea poritis]MDA4843957.1 CAP domain-containing protein [Hoeflea poritis]
MVKNKQRAARVEIEMIHRRTFLSGSGGALVVAVLGGLISTPAEAANGNIVTGQALRSVNAFRKANGRGALQSDSALGRAALEHSLSMARSGRLNHSRFQARLRNHGIRGAAAENVARGQPNVASVVASWQGSRGHRRNMLGNFSRAGVAVARDPASGNRPFWTMILAR